MKIAYIINQYPQASQSFIRREIAGLEKLGVVVRRFTVRRWSQKLVDPGDLAEESKTRAVLDGGKGASLARLIGATISTLVTRPARFFAALRTAMTLGGRAHRRLIHLIYLAEACVLRPWLANNGVDHVHAHFGTNSTAVAMLIHSLGGPVYSFTVHGPEEFDHPVDLALDLKAHSAAMVVAVSEFGRSQLFRWCHAQDWPKVKVIHCGVDASYLTETTAVPETPCLVCVGRLAEQKGQVILIDAAALLAAKGVQFQLVLIGDGPMRSEIEARIARHRLTDSVRLAGWMSNEQIRNEMKAAKALVLPSFAEGLPVVIMESLALGRPVISTYVAGIPELLRNGENGWLVPAGDAEALAMAMEHALSCDVAELTCMGEAGAMAVRERHDAAREAGKLWEAMKSLQQVNEPLTPALSPEYSGEGAVRT